MELKNKLINHLQGIVNGHESWCGDHGIFTPHLSSKYVKELLIEVYKMPSNHVGISTGGLKMKKYLIIESCMSCPLRTYDHEQNRFYCNEKDLTVPYHGVGKSRQGFPTWCPLNNLPDQNK